MNDFKENISTIVYDYLRSSFRHTASISDIVEDTGLNRKSVSNALSRGFLNGILDRVERGVYKYNKFYIEVLHTKRIIDTSTAKPIHEWDCDLEATAIGLAPNHLDIKDIERILNPKLIESVIEEIGDQGVMLIEERVNFSIMGTEIKDRTETRYDDTFDVTIDFTNNVGKKYLFKTKFKVRLQEWQI